MDILKPAEEVETVAEQEETVQGMENSLWKHDLHIYIYILENQTGNIKSSMWSKHHIYACGREH